MDRDLGFGAVGDLLPQHYSFGQYHLPTAQFLGAAVAASVLPSPRVLSLTASLVPSFVVSLPFVPANAFVAPFWRAALPGAPVAWQDLDLGT